MSAQVHTRSLKLNLQLMTYSLYCLAQLLLRVITEQFSIKCFKQLVRLTTVRAALITQCNYSCHSLCISELFNSIFVFWFCKIYIRIYLYIILKCQSVTDPDPSPPCPVEEPAPGSLCSAILMCSYGEECCCGQCSASIVFTCQGVTGVWQAYFTDACLLPSCRNLYDNNMQPVCLSLFAGGLPSNSSSSSSSPSKVVKT